MTPTIKSAYINTANLIEGGGIDQNTELAEAVLCELCGPNLAATGSKAHRHIGLISRARLLNFARGNLIIFHIGFLWGGNLITLGAEI